MSKLRAVWRTGAFVGFSAGVLAAYEAGTLEVPPPANVLMIPSMWKPISEQPFEGLCWR